MTAKADGINFSWSIAVSIFIHACAFMFLKIPLEYGRVVYYSSLPVELYNLSEPRKNQDEKNVPKEKPEEKKKKEETVNIKKNIKETKQKDKETEEIKKQEEPRQEQQAQAKFVTIDIKEFPFPWYLSLIENKVKEKWEKPQGLEALTGRKAVIYFRITRSGEITDMRIETASGDAGLDISGMRAVKEAGTMPPLPAEFGEEYLSVHFGFEIY